MGTQERGEMLKRFRAFGVRIVKASAKLSEKPACRSLAKQLLRSGTSVGAIYHEACHASTKRHFITTLEIAQREARETIYWLDLIADAELLPAKRPEPLRQECDELTAILTASIKTAKSRA